VLRRRPLRVLVALGGVVLVTYVAYRVIPVNATTVGFINLLLILIVASTWGFLEAAFASVLATLVFSFFFLPPVGHSPSPIHRIWSLCLAFWQPPSLPADCPRRLRRERPRQLNGRGISSASMRLAGRCCWSTGALPLPNNWSRNWQRSSVLRQPYCTSAMRGNFIASGSRAPKDLRTTFGLQHCGKGSLRNSGPPT
jgi:hypothetical protein